MRADYPNWLVEQKYTEGAQSTQISRVNRIEASYGSLDDHFVNGTYDNEVISTLQYSASDERAAKDNPSKIDIKGNLRNGLAACKWAAELYRKFLNDKNFQAKSSEPNQPLEVDNILSASEEIMQQGFGFERDMQASLRRNIVSLDPALKIVDDGIERKVDTGFIDITCEDATGIVVVELKAGKTDSRVIAQIMGYMSDVQEEEGDKPVRGILVAHEFDKRTKAAARLVPTLKLMKYAIEFKFTAEE